MTITNLDTVVNSFLRDFDVYNRNTNSLYTYKVYSKDNDIIFKCLAPGMTKEDFDISFDSKKLFIKTSKDSGDKDFKTSFNESINLYKKIDVDNSYADLSKGVLTITMPLDKSNIKKKISFR